MNGQGHSRRVDVTGKIGVISSYIGTGCMHPIVPLPAGSRAVTGLVSVCPHAQMSVAKTTLNIHVLSLISVAANRTCKA